MGYIKVLLYNNLKRGEQYVSTVERETNFLCQ